MSGRPRSPRRGDYRRDDRDRDYRRDDRRADYGRRRSPGRYDRDRYDDRRPARRNDERPRERSRDRKRSRDRSPVPVRERRDRSRDRDGRYRDDSRDHKRPRRTDSIESRRRAPRDDDRERRGITPAKQDVAAIAKDKAAEEERIKLERQAKVEEWKKKREAERLRKEQGAANAQSPAADSSRPTTAINSPKPAVTSTTTDSPAPASPAAATTSPQPDAAQSNGAAAQKGFAGKFDHKAIAKKATTATSKLQPLGSDINIPGKSKSAAVPATASSNKAADSSNKSSTSFGKAVSAKSASNALSRGFGLNQAPIEEKEASQPGPGIDMDDEQVERRKLEKLPTPDLDDNTGDAAHANGVENNDDDGDLDIADAGTEEELAAAARAAAEKRAAEAADASVEPDAMEGVQSTAPTNGHVQAEEEEEEEEDEVDPLDAFMSGLTEEAPKTTRKTKTRNRLLEPEAIFSDDDGADMEAVGEDPDEILAMASKRKKKEIPTVDHSKIEYEPFRKNFYTEPQELKDMSEEAVQALRFDLDGIKVQGKDVPRPVQKFAQFGLGTQALDIIRNLGFEKPTPIQSQTIPAIMSGRDIIGVAKTGSGKTVAFLLPMFRHIKDQRPLANMEGPIGLVLAPTRELAQQIHRECRPYLKALSLRAVCAYGGAPIKDQIAELKRGAEIIVCTPGRMVDLLAANAGRVTNLRRVTYVVLDEADRMFDMGFEPQVVKILTNIRPDHQTVLFSATMPRNMESLARKVLRKPVQITVGGRSTVSDTITQVIEVRTEGSKMFRTLELLGELFQNDEDARALIFVERQEAADKMMLELQQKGYPSSSIHGGREQIDREQAIDNFKRGDIPILVATSIAARGLDVQQLRLVINYDVPNHLEDYVHRSGRTGRAGNTGTAVTFITAEQDKYAVDLVKALKMSNKDVPDELEALSKGFLGKFKEGKVKASGGGFGGRGIERFEEQRAAERARERKAYKTGDDDEEEEKEEVTKEDIKLPEINIVKRGDETTGGDSPAPAPKPAVPSGIPAHIDLDADVKVHKTEIPAPTTSARPSGGVAAAAAAAALINSRLGARNSTRPGVPIDNKGPDAGAYHATLEINDFPQKARWAVTNRTNVAKILEATGVSITSKGNYYLPPAQPGPNDAPKLYILVEGDTELQVTQAMRDLQRLLKEGTMAAADADARAPASGRYTVT
ncbi:hypothetical protein BDV97DRAFT_394881 [Delphinella strobiligena]|nr:hypothetical protein BDV97DRAFT_394881 [Delphinella strobiligena]